jgi:hypothetical protein
MSRQAFDLSQWSEAIEFAPWNTNKTPLEASTPSEKAG